MVVKEKNRVCEEHNVVKEVSEVLRFDRYVFGEPMIKKSEKSSKINDKLVRSISIIYLLQRWSFMDFIKELKIAAMKQKQMKKLEDDLL